MQIIVFSLGEKYYGFKTDKVLEISKKLNPTKVPNSPDWVEGLVNLRGSIVTMVNLSKLLHLDESLCYNKFIILDNENEKIGLMVTDVNEVINISNEDFQKIDSSEENGIIGIVELDGNIVNIMNINDLLFKNEG